MKPVRSFQNFVTVTWSFFEKCGGDKFRLRDNSRHFTVHNPSDFMHVMEFVETLRRSFQYDRPHISVSFENRSFSF